MVYGKKLCSQVNLGKYLSTGKNALKELWVKLYLGQNENYSLGNSISDSSEVLALKIQWKEVSIVYGFADEGKCSQVHILA